MAIRLYQRLDGGPLEPGEFRVEDGGMGARIVRVACPRCGHAAIVEYPRLRWPCASESCAFAEFLQLEEVLR